MREIIQLEQPGWTIQQNNPFKLKTKLKDAIFDIGPVTTRAHEYHNNLKFLLSHTQQKFKGGNDIVKSIKEKQHVDFVKNQPAMALSKNEDKKIRAIKQALLDDSNRTLQKCHEQELSTTKAIHQEYMPFYGHNSLNPYNRGSRH